MKDTTKQQITFINKLLDVHDNDSSSDMAGYIYLYEKKLRLILKEKQYEDKWSKWLNELGMYYKKFIMGKPQFRTVSQQQRIENFRAKYSKHL